MAHPNVLQSPSPLSLHEVLHEALTEDDTRALTLIEPEIPAVHAHGTVMVDGARGPIPYTIAIPEELTHDTLAVIAPGFGAIKRTSRGFRDAMASEQGVATASYNPARLHSSRREWGRHICDPQQLHYDTLEAVVKDVRNNPAVKEHPKGKAIIDAGVTVLAHSMGNLPAAEYAVEHSSEVDALIMMGALGLEDPSLLRLIWRTKDEVLLDIVPAIAQGHFGYNPQMARSAISYFARNPSRTIGEIASCGRADIRGLVAQAGKLGVKRAAICFENDRFFYPADTLASVQDVVDCYTTLKGSEHTAVQTEPARVARMAGRVLQRLAVA